MIWLVLYSTFVHKMLAAQAGYIIYLWSVKWVIDDGVAKFTEDQLFMDESWELYKEFKLIAFICALFLIPIIGFLSDKMDMGHKMILMFGMRVIASLAYFVIESPHGDIVVLTLVALTLASTLQSTIIEALFTKRLPGDVRGSLKGVRALFGHLGYIVCAMMSLACVNYFGDIHRVVCFSALFDGSVVFFSAVAFMIAGFEDDEHTGKSVRKKGAKGDAILKEAEKKKKA